MERCNCFDGWLSAAFLAVGTIAAMTASARNVASLSIDRDSNTATVAFEQAASAETNALYFVWSHDGVDKGTDIAGWPNVVRVGLVDETDASLVFALPEPAHVIRLYAARVFLATPASTAYDYLTEKTISGGSSYIDTGVLPERGKTVVAVDFKLDSITSTGQYVFGSYAGTSTFTFCGYVSDSKNWSFAAASGSSPWVSFGKSGTTDRTRMTLDASSGTTVVCTLSNAVVNVQKTQSSSGKATTTHTLHLFQRHASTVKSMTGAIYSCAITNDGVCVRDYVPASKDGVGGMFDRVSGVFFASASATAFTAGANVNYFVAEGDVMVAYSPAWTLQSFDYTTESPLEETASVIAPAGAGGSKSGAAPLLLSGANDWGGSFTVNEGTLVADFGQGLASTDNLVLNGGTYGLLSGNVFNWTAGAGGGQVSLGEGSAERFGFSTYGKPFSVVANGDASVPVEIGTVSGFNPTRFVLNDTWATDTLTFKNGFIGNNGDSTLPLLRIVTEAADAVVEGGVSNVTFYKWGSGTLRLRGAANKFGIVYPRGGKLYIAPPDGAESCNLELAGMSIGTNVANTIVVSNTVVSHSGANSMTWYGNNSLSLVGCTVTSAGNWYPANRSGPTGSGYGESASLTLDGTSLSVTSSGVDFMPGYYSGAKSYCTAALTMTNNATLDLACEFSGRYGSMHQYGGKVTVRRNSSTCFRLGTQSVGTFYYYLHSGTLALTGASSGFNLGCLDGKMPKGYFYLYNGGEVSVAGSAGYIGRYAGNAGYFYIRGGTARFTKSDAALYVGYVGNGTCEVSSGGLLDVQAGAVRVLPVSAQTGRTGTLSVLSGGTVKSRGIYSTCTNDTATLVLDSANLVANASASANFLYGFTSASVGVGGVVVDTAGQDIRFEQSFGARSGQEAPSAATAAELAALPAFTKSGEGVLTLIGTNEWLCATCVSNGTLAVGERALPATTLRLGGGVIDLGGNSFTVENLVGSGVVSNGTLTVTGTVWPGVGDSGVLQVDSSAEIAFSRIGCCIAPDGRCGRLKLPGAIDLSGVVVVGEGFGNLRDGLEKTLVEAESITGVPVSEGLGDARVSVVGGRLAIRVSGMLLLIM